MDRPRQPPITYHLPAGLQPTRRCRAVGRRKDGRYETYAHCLGIYARAISISVMGALRRARRRCLALLAEAEAEAARRAGPGAGAGPDAPARPESAGGD